ALGAAGDRGAGVLVVAVRGRAAGDTALMGLVLTGAVRVADLGGAAVAVVAVSGSPARHAAGDGGMRARTGVAGVRGARVAVVARRGRRARHAAGDCGMRAGSRVAR